MPPGHPTVGLAPLGAEPGRITGLDLSTVARRLLQANPLTSKLILRKCIPDARGL